MRLLKDRVLSRCRRVGVELSSSELLRVLSDLNRWVCRGSCRDKLVKTADGSLTLVSSHYGEPFHSISAGALTESIHKFVKPSLILSRALQRKSLVIADVGFGLGYNTATAVFFAKRLNPKLELRIYSFDKTYPQRVVLLPEPFKGVQKMLLGLLPEGWKEGVYLKFYEGDFRKTFPLSEAENLDTVLHDPFSPYRNPEMWTLEVLALIKARMKPEGMWVSYSSSLSVRRALWELGFNLGETKPVGRRRGGTSASPGLALRLRCNSALRLRTSPYSLPMRDPNLCEDPLNILIDYRINVLLRERELSSGQNKELLQQLSSKGLPPDSM